MRAITYLFACLLLIAFTACGGNKTSKKNNGKDTLHVDSSSNKPAPMVDAQLDDLARLLAGLPPNENYKNIADTGFYRKYKRSMDAEWDTLESEMIQPILKWSKENINHTLKGNKTCFYPFSGADFLYANLFFPDADNYILIGLEPPGSVSDPNKMSKEDLSNYLYSNDNAMGVSHDKGFYRTNSMRVDFSKKYLNGTVHNILFYVVRRGYKVTGIDYFSLDTVTGVPQYTKAVYGEKNSNYGVKVKYTDDKGGDKAIYYMKYDLWNPNFEKRPELLKFVDGFGGHYLFLKAASYLSQYPGYTIIHDYMMNSSSLVVQDDSGIPYKSFTNGAWEINLLGNFETVLPLFHNYNQPDLKAAYDKLSEIKRLPFQIGYNVSIGESNMQYCIKKDWNIITKSKAQPKETDVPVKGDIKVKKTK